MNIPDILKTYKTVAVVGCSKDETKDSNTIARFLKGVGYRIIPVNPTAKEILGEKCYDSLLSIKEPVGIVDVFRPGAEALDIARQAVEIGARVVWLQEGITNNEARKYAEDHGVAFVQDKCTMKEYMKL